MTPDDVTLTSARQTTTHPTPSNQTPFVEGRARSQGISPAGALIGLGANAQPASCRAAVTVGYQHVLPETAIAEAVEVAD